MGGAGGGGASTATTMPCPGVIATTYCPDPRRDLIDFNSRESWQTAHAGQSR
jgi:hypothetical protein